MTKTIGGGSLKRRQHLGELEPGQPGHLDVEEDAVDVALAQHPQPVGRRVAGAHRGDALVARQQPLELVERRPLVVDDQHPQARRRPAHADTPAANFGTRTTTLVPAPGAVSTTSP